MREHRCSLLITKSVQVVCMLRPKHQLAASGNCSRIFVNGGTFCLLGRR